MGFGQEIKDFLSAYKQGEAVETARTDREYKKALQDALVKKTARENDPDTLAQADEKAKAELQLLRARTGAVGASTALTQARRKALLDAGGVPGAGGVPSGLTTGMAVQPQSIVNPDDTPVQHFAEGGFVEDDEDLDTGDDIVPTPAVGGGATDMSARSRNTGSLSGIAPQLVHDAVKGGLTYGANQMGLGQQRGVGTAAQRQKAMDWQRVFGAIPPQELDAVKKAVDPEGKMTEAQRNMMALGQVYQFQMNKGNPEGAQRAAFQVLQAYRLDAQRYASIAAHAAENGDLTTAAQAAVKAYANIPDGRDIAVFKDEDGKLNYSYTDAATGKTIVKGLLTPQQLAAQATGIAAGGFDKLILQAAGQRVEEATKGKGGGAGALKVGDQAKLLEGVEGAVGKLTEQAEKDKKPITPESTKALTGAAYRIQQANSHLTPDEAVTAARDIIGNTDKDAFKVDKGEDGTNTVTFGGKSAVGEKMRLKLSDEALEPLIAMRGIALAAAKKKKDGDNKPGTDWKGIATSAGEAIGGIAGDAGKALGAVGEAAAGAVGRSGIGDYLDRSTIRPREAIGRAVKPLENPGDVPATEPPL